MSTISSTSLPPNIWLSDLSRTSFAADLHPIKGIYRRARLGSNLASPFRWPPRRCRFLPTKRSLFAAIAAGPTSGQLLRFDQTFKVKVVYVLMPEERANYSVVPLDLLIDSLSHPAHDPDAAPEQYSVQFSFLPKEEEVQYVKELLAPTKSNWELCGVVAISCSREIYRYLHRQGVPLVVLGSLDHDLQELPSIDADHFECGRLLAQYLFSNGHERIAMLGISNGRPGDHDFLDGIVEADDDRRQTAEFAYCPPLPQRSRYAASPGGSDAGSPRSSDGRSLSRRADAEPHPANCSPIGIESAR